MCPDNPAGIGTGVVGATTDRSFTSAVNRFESVAPSRANGGLESRDVTNDAFGSGNVEITSDVISVTSCSVTAAGVPTVNTNIGQVRYNPNDAATHDFVGTIPQNDRTTTRNRNVRFYVYFSTVPSGYFSDEAPPFRVGPISHTCVQAGTTVSTPVFDANSAELNNEGIGDGDTSGTGVSGATYTITAPTCTGCVGGTVQTNPDDVVIDGITYTPSGAGTFNHPPPANRAHSWIYSNRAGTAVYTILLESGEQN